MNKAMKMVLCYSTFLCVTTGYSMAAPVVNEPFSTKLAKSNNIKEEEARKELDRVFGGLAAELRSGQRVVVPGFGAFSITQRKISKEQSAGPNAKSDGVTRSVRFTVAKEFRNELNSSAVK